MAQPRLQNKTERSLYERLHRDVDSWRHEWALAERNTTYARKAIERWIEDGILEVREDVSHPASSYVVKHYRLAPEWRDEALIDQNLLDSQAANDAASQQNAAQLAHARVQMQEAWSVAQRALSGDAPGEDEALRDTYVTANDLANCARRLQSLLREEGRLAQVRDRLDSAVRTRAATAPVPEGDPLGGDA